MIYDGQVRQVVDKPRLERPPISGLEPFGPWPRAPQLATPRAPGALISGRGPDLRTPPACQCTPRQRHSPPRRPNKWLRASGSQQQSPYSAQSTCTPTYEPSLHGQLSPAGLFLTAASLPFATLPPPERDLIMRKKHVHFGVHEKNGDTRTQNQPQKKTTEKAHRWKHRILTKEGGGSMNPRQRGRRG